MSDNGITMTKVGGETGLSSVLDSGTVGSKVGGAIGLIKKEGETLSYSSDGKSWTPLSGGGSGGGGAFDLVKVSSYKPPFQNVTELTLSGITDHEIESEPGVALVGANGKYQLYMEAGFEGGAYPVYKHETEEFYLGTADEMTGNSPAKADDENVVWFLFRVTQTPDLSLAFLIKHGKELTNGTETWNNISYGFSDEVTVEITGGSSEEITVQKATSYDAAQDAYTFDGTDVTASGSQFAPKPHGVYAMSASRLIGDPVGSEYGNACRAYIEGRTLPETDASGYVVLTPDWGETMVASGDTSFALVQKAGIDVAEITGSGGIGDVDAAEYPHTYSEDFFDLTLSAAFWGGDEGISNKFTAVLGFGRYSNNGICIAINWYNPITVLGVIGKALSIEHCYKFETPSIVGGWHHAALVYSGSTETATLYVDGVERGNFSGNPNLGGYKWLYFGGDGGGDELGGCRREMKLWNVALTPEQVQAEFQRCKTLFNINPIS